jgi:Arc/MetJ-type ribon-helix-helix transcriptional regulator
MTLTLRRFGITIVMIRYYPGKAMKTVSVKLPPTLHARLERAARQGGQTKSDVVREALENLLNVSRATRPAARSALDLAGDLVGSIDGPGDLSTNPNYLKGLGD